jgi:tetratricopeptide (TPR) repeat protein
MTSLSPPVRIFVAMPGTITGDDRWDNIAEIKKSLLERVAKRIGEQLGRETALVIEQDKLTGVVIYDSMYGEAIQSDVYIADLTGANPNVYLELGVRWALRDGVTIVIAQDIEKDVKFNAKPVRAFLYGPKPNELEIAINKIVTAAVIGLRDSRQVDSLVRKGLSLVQVSRNELDALKQEIVRLKAEKADELVAAARTAAPAQAIGLLRQAIDRDPLSSEAHYQLGLALRKAAEYPEAIAQLRDAVRLKDDYADAWRELGVAHNKARQFTDAEAAFDRAMELNDQDAETWATVGGLKRRLAKPSAGSAFDWTRLRESRYAYHRANELRPNDSYALLNEARLDLLLSTEDPSTRPAILGRLSELEDLARYEARTGDPWKLFDLADTFLLTGRVREGLDTLRSAIKRIDLSQRESYLTSYLGPQHDFLAVAVLDEPAASGVRKAINVSEEAIETAKTQLAS